MPPEISSGINREDLADRQEEIEKSNESSCVTTTQNDLTSSTPAMFLSLIHIYPKDANNLGNYAVFLKNQRKDYDKAEEYYRRAVEACLLYTSRCV